MPIYRRLDGRTACLNCRLSFFLALTAMAGCSGGAAKITEASVDPATAAAAAIEQLDKNGDGSLDATEIEACPPLKGALASYDSSSDGALSEAEIEQRLTALYQSGVALANFDCTVTSGGRSLIGATVKLRPVGFLADSLLPAEGTTDEQGVARPTIGDEHIPEKLKGAPLLYPGLYHVEITHGEVTIPARYNSATELGADVDPTSRTGTSAAFALQAN